MPPKWKEIAIRNIDKEDEIQKSYPGKLDGKNGYLLLSNKKLLFVQEEGFLSRRYDLTLDLPYERIEKVSQNSRYDLNLTDVEGKMYEYRNLDMPVSYVEDSIKELKK